ncbi:hypothetical protein [Dysgonomonas mossii]|uniref:hypothetical protein n=1 Tax=Dysgonomonas mossii TaxID=163665 RepID=UPI0039943920
MRQPFVHMFPRREPVRCGRRRKGWGDSPFIPFRRQTGDRSPGNAALDFCLLFGNEKVKTSQRGRVSAIFNLII